MPALCALVQRRGPGCPRGWGTGSDSVQLPVPKRPWRALLGCPSIASTPATEGIPGPTPLSHKAECLAPERTDAAPKAGAHPHSRIGVPRPLGHTPPPPTLQDAGEESPRSTPSSHPLDKPRPVGPGKQPLPHPQTEAFRRCSCSLVSKAQASSTQSSRSQVSCVAPGGTRPAPSLGLWTTGALPT